jgi:hypothetical protein
MATTSKIVEPTSKRQKITLENGNSEKINEIKIFDSKNK